MKRKFLQCLCVAIIVALLFSSCSASKGSDSSSSLNGATSTESENVSLSMDEADSAPPPEETGEEIGQGSLSEKPDGDFTEKIIYSANANIETTEFDQTVDNVYTLVDTYGGYIESSYVTGKDYREEFYGYQSYRYAEFVIRVPVQGYGSLTGELDTLGNVLSINEISDNITVKFYDSQSRLDTYKIEEQRLLAMLEKAETVTDMIEIESRISEVRYEIESLESLLRTWQNQVDYSTVTISINEVRELTPKVERERSYWQQIWDGLRDSVRSIGRFFKDLFMGFVISLPVVITVALGATAIILIIKRIVKVIKMKKLKKKDDGES